MNSPKKTRWVYYDFEKKEFQRIKGPVKIIEMNDLFDDMPCLKNPEHIFILHQTPLTFGSNKDLWTITHTRTGASIVSCQCDEETAIKTAKDRIRKNGEKGFLLAEQNALKIISQKQEEKPNA